MTSTLVSVSRKRPLARILSPSTLTFGVIDSPQ
jgi:hypothetical protein